MHFRRDQPRDVRHVGDDRRADGATDVAHALEVEDAGIGAGADHDHLRLVLVRQPLELVVVDPLIVLADAVGDDRVELAGEVERMAVGEMAAVGEVHAEHGVARLQQREIDRHVGLRAGVRLHVGVLGAEQLLGALDGQRFGDVHELAAAVVALAGVAFRVLVGQDRTGRLQHRLADEVLRGDQLEPGVLALDFVANGAGDLGIGLGEGPPAGLGQGRCRHCAHLPGQSCGFRRLRRRAGQRCSDPLAPFRSRRSARCGAGAVRLRRRWPATRATISSARPHATIRPPRASTLASLC